MLRTTRFLIACLTLATLLLPQVALADGMIIPAEFEIAYLTVRYHHVTVEIHDNHAVTHVEQAFHNPSDLDVTAEYLFPVPPDAMVTNFQATLDGQAQSPRRRDVEAANATLRDLVAERHDPSLLQYLDWEMIVFEVTVPAGETRTMTLEYEEVLAPQGGMLHYRYVLSTERYSFDALENASITVDLSSASGIGALYSSSHAVITERIGPGKARVNWEAEFVRPTEDFHLYFTPSDGGFGSGLLTGRQPGLDAGQDHFLFLFAPDLVENETALLPKDIVFVIDRSGSMEGEKMVQAKDALQFILGQLDENDRFSIVSFDDRLDVFARTLKSVDTRTIRDARGFVEELYARDSTDLDMALERGLEVLRSSPDRPGAMRLLVFLTDGLPTSGITDPYEIAERAESRNLHVEARMHVFGVGYDVNTHLLDRLAEENGGSVTYAQPGENLELVLTDFYSRIAHPVLTDLEIDFAGMTATHLHPRHLPDMFEGSSLLLVGRYTPSDEGHEVTVRVTGRTGEERRTFTYTFDLQETGDFAFVPRLWATREIGLLLDQVRVEGETASLVDRIRDLGLTYGLVTPYTTFAIAAQTGGVASMENMALYGNRGALNQAYGQITIQARVQNQAYQQAAQASLAVGANVRQSGHQNLAQVNHQVVDLWLLRDVEDPEVPLTEAWIADNIAVDRQVHFGSEDYFELAADPVGRAFLQAGNNVIFRHGDEVIQVVDPDAPDTSFELQAVTGETAQAGELTGNLVPFDNTARPATPGTTDAPRIVELLSTLREIRLVVSQLLREVVWGLTH
ncbi:MAG: VWA domain-containing protein [Anaerolineae bacterium]